MRASSDGKSSDAKRVLPHPPGPTMVTRRRSGSWNHDRSSRRSASRPTKLVPTNRGARPAVRGDGPGVGAIPLPASLTIRTGCGRPPSRSTWRPSSSKHATSSAPSANANRASEHTTCPGPPTAASEANMASAGPPIMPASSTVTSPTCTAMRKHEPPMSRRSCSAVANASSARGNRHKTLPSGAGIDRPLGANTFDQSISVAPCMPSTRSAT